MQIENSFTVPAPLDHLWSYMLDVEKVAPCMPGAELTEIVDDHTWKGKVTVKLGPVSLSFAGTVSMEERDDAARRVVLKAQGMEQKGKGAATATVTSWLEPGEGSTTVNMQADITMSGMVAQLSRGMLPDVSAKLTDEFAKCLRASMIAAEESAAETGGEPPRGGRSAPSARSARLRAPAPAAAAGPRAKPVAGVRLGLWALWRGIVRLFRRTPP